MKFAYADPPYVGQGNRYAEKEEVNQSDLVNRLVCGYPDGWALSCSSPSLGQILSYCHVPVRVMAWVKPFAVFKPNVGVAYAWEPVIFSGGRKRARTQPTVRDWVSANITLKRGLVGAKPPAFNSWLLDVFNYIPSEDTLDDLFPGTNSLSYEISARAAQGVAP